MATGWLTSKDVDDYGPEVLDLAQRAALHALTPDLQALNHANADLRAQLAQEQRRALYQTLDSSLPNWKEVNADPQWHAWLAGTHPYSAVSRQRHLDEAVARNDTACVIRLFRDFLAQREQRQDLQQASPAPLSGKRIYTRAHIDQYSPPFPHAPIPP